MNANNIIEKYNLSNLEVDEDFHKKIKDKWIDHVGEGWYGYAINDCPTVWGKVVDDFLTELKTVDPNFSIHQIKIKFGGLRLYLGLSSDVEKEFKEHINEQINILENKLFNESLIF